MLDPAPPYFNFHQNKMIPKIKLFQKVLFNCLNFVRVERIFEDLQGSITKKSIIEDFQLNKLPLVITRITALMGILVRIVCFELIEQQTFKLNHVMLSTFSFWINFHIKKKRKKKKRMREKEQNDMFYLVGKHQMWILSLISFLRSLFTYMVY